MTFNWYKVVNLDDFQATELVSQEIEVILQGIGTVTILVTQGNDVSLVYDGTMLSLNASGHNPFVFDGKAVYLDVNNDLWLGIEIDED